MANEQQKDTRTASQRIDDMERGLMAIYQTADNMARDMQTIKEAIKLLGNKLDSVVKASANGEALSDEVIARIMVENNVEELKGKVTDLVNQGILVSSDEVGPNSFVVGRELSEDGTVQNPRMQFVVSALQEEVRNKFPGSKVGQTLDLQEGKWKFEVQEIYSIQTPAAPVAESQPEAEQAPAVEPSSASEAPASESAVEAPAASEAAPADQAGAPAPVEASSDASPAAPSDSQAQPEAAQSSDSTQA